MELDLQNPRLPKHVRDQNDIAQIRNYLLDKEDVLRIARSIANNKFKKNKFTINHSVFEARQGKEILIFSDNVAKVAIS